MLSGRDQAVENLSNAELALSGAIAGIVGWMSTFWADTIKTRVQASRSLVQLQGAEAAAGSAETTGLLSNPSRDGATLREHGGRSFALQARGIWAESGFRGFWKGAGPTILR